MPRFSYVSIAECAAVDGAAVVIDVLRAFSFAAYAFDAGAEGILMVDTVDEARALKSALPGAIACKDGAKTDGFECTNSPVQLLEVDVRGRAIVHRTHNGTRGALAARNCTPMYCASFVVAAATADALRAADPDRVTFVVTGHDGGATEDLACARFIAALLDDPATDPTPFLAAARASDAAAHINEGVARGYTGVRADDVEWCLRANRFDFAMRATDAGDRVTLVREEVPRSTTG